MREIATNSSGEVIKFTGERGELITGELVSANDALLPPTAQSSPRAPAIAVDRILQAAPDLAKAVQGGRVMRVIGGPDGPLWEVPGGVLGTVRKDGRIVGHLKFDRPPKQVRVVAAPAAAFQVASAVTLQYYLNTITSQLEALQRGVHDVKDKLKREDRAQLEAATESCEEISRHLASGIELRADDWVKLNRAQEVARRRFASSRDALKDFEKLIRKAVADDGKIQDAKQFKQALRVAVEDALHEYHVMLEAASLRLRALALTALGEAESDSRRVESTRESALHQVARVREELVGLSDLLARLNVRASALDAEYSGLPFDRKPARELEAFRSSTKTLRRLLREPVDRWLPPPGAIDPWILEVRPGKTGELETRMERLEVAPAG